MHFSVHEKLLHSSKSSSIFTYADIVMLLAEFVVKAVEEWQFWW
jgi:hypothetical protein